MKLGPGANFIELLIKQRNLLSNIKQTTSQNAYILYESFAGNQRNTQIVLVSIL